MFNKVLNKLSVVFVQVGLFVCIASVAIFNTLFTFHILQWKKALFQFAKRIRSIFESESAAPNYISTPSEHYKAQFALQYGMTVSRTVNDPQFLTFYYKREDVEGMIPYRAFWGTAVAIGDPICKPEHTQIIVDQFYEFCHTNHWQCVFAPASQDFADMFQGHKNVAIVQFGDEGIFNPMTKNRFSGRANRGIKSKVSQAKKSGLQVHELNDINSPLAIKLEEVRKTWMDSRRGVQAYLCAMELFSDPLGKRWFYAVDKKGEVASVLVLLRMEKLQGYVIKNLFTLPEAPKGTSELLVVQMMEQLAKENCTYLTFGPCVSDRLFSVYANFDSPTAYLISLVGICKEKGFFSAGSSMQFRKKYVPQDIQASYLVFYQQTSINLYNFLALLNVFHVLNADVEHARSNSSQEECVASMA